MDLSAGLCLTAAVVSAAGWARSTRQELAGREKHATALAELDHARYESRHDHLTGLLNRRGWMSGAEQQLPRLQSAAAILIIDVDDFKHVNDRFGHAGGDRLLVALARRLRHVASQHQRCCLIGRLGGDEFAVLLTATAGRRATAQFHAAAQDLAQVLGEPIPDVPLRTGVSIGLAPTGAAAPLSACLAAADAAMYRAKTQGMTVAEYDPALDATRFTMPISPMPQMVSTPHQLAAVTAAERPRPPSAMVAVPVAARTLQAARGQTADSGRGEQHRNPTDSPYSCRRSSPRHGR